MALAERLMSVFFTGAAAPKQTSVQLRNGNRILAELPVKEWQVSGATVTTIARFGPFPGATEFDRVAVVDDTGTLDVNTLGLMMLRQGAQYEHEFILKVSGGA